MKILILTVGGSYQPLLTAIRSIRPDRIIFLCSDDQGAAKGSYTQIEGAGKVLCSQVSPSVPTKPDLPNLATLAGLSKDQYGVVPIAQFDSLQECYVKAAELIRREKRCHPDAEIIADYTGGTKSMAAALASAALDEEKCQLSLVNGTRSDLSIVQPGTQFTRPVVVGDLRARRRLAEVTKALERFDYAAALQILEAVAMMPVSGSLLDRIGAAIAVCRAFDAWDRFCHAQARDLLWPYRGKFVEHFQVLEELSKPQPRDPYLRVEDLLLNAERRVAQQRFDDAVARVYRAVEMLAQVRLHTKYKLDTSNIDINRVPRNLREELGKKRRKDGKLTTALLDSWELLHALGDHPLGAWFDRQQQALKSFLTARNDSILAHGATPIWKDNYDRNGRSGLELCREALAQLAPNRGERRAKQLPQQLPWLEVEAEM